ncbi:hypothetical protein ElyMa_004592700 [Elysia marginata]|uniref:Uncharacterized protein n=1 Tax=Elysia marginata TaxID=1093978 RepID=A0AAV4HVW5_9GAST|nr:hypothetical protein ElyMa_004592700 [Elysia marginata]
MCLNSLSQGLNIDLPKAGLEPRTSRSERRASTTRPRRHTKKKKKQKKEFYVDPPQNAIYKVIKGSEVKLPSHIHKYFNKTTGTENGSCYSSLIAHAPRRIKHCFCFYFPDIQVFFLQHSQGYGLEPNE